MAPSYIQFCYPNVLSGHIVLISVNSLHPASIICLRASLNYASNHSDVREDTAHGFYYLVAEITSLQTPFQTWKVQLARGCFGREEGFLQRLPPYSCVLLCFVLLFFSS